ncbi:MULTISPECIES: ATP-binding cassette domain-containing protein [Streptacidiphilus]|uniref:ATP-binding cassette domain-containing protein n=1 Tax=Streptacidiphilus cavernicola TaxID=3342716 RepID=A0ABV6UJQ4_9ACTN|nr:ATP-binding cassette domain-containing protein [Streptacidiphilus jeojiense]
MQGYDETTRSGAVPGPTRIVARGVGVVARGGGEILRGISLAVEPGRLLALAGSSGAGKTTLLEVLAGVRAPDRGTVLRADVPAGDSQAELGFVPQDDIIHRDLPLARTLAYAARLRLPAGTGSAEVQSAVDRVLDALGLTGRAGVRVGLLSGGERKRASIAVELLTRPAVLFLDEPTSGLDPATGAELITLLRDLSRRGTAVVLTTHTPADLSRCDTVGFLSPDGRLVHLGPPEGLGAHFGVDTVEEVYGVVTADTPDLADEGPGADVPTAEARSAPAQPLRPLGALGQWALLTRRSADIMIRNRLSVAVLAGSPVMIVIMFVMLFRAGAFDPADPSPGTAAMILFWIAFGAFFFGLTYGLLQICTEIAVVRRERLTVLRLGPYVLAKATVLLPVLAAADALLLAVLRALDRLPAAGWSVYGSLFATTVLASAAALALGLLASAAVSEPGQATLMLPLLCFPQVLFSGAFVPVPQMAWPGWALSWAMTNRWAFESLGSGIGLNALWAHGRSPLGPPLLASYGDTFGGPTARGWIWLAGFTVLFLTGAWALLARSCPRARAVAVTVAPSP